MAKGKEGVAKGEEGTFVMQSHNYMIRHTQLPPLHIPDCTLESYKLEASRGKRRELRNASQVIKTSQD